MTKYQQAVKNSKVRPSNKWPVSNDLVDLFRYIDLLELYSTALEVRLENGIDTGQWI